MTSAPAAVSPTPTDVDLFLDRTEFDGYQSVPLPHGRRTPGKDLSARAETILGDRVAGRTVLDIGTNYGYFAYEAIRRGAAAAVGVEADPERATIAARISELNGSRYSIIEGHAEQVAFEDPFDVVICLNVLHHLPDPITAVLRLASIARESLIVEFPTAHERFFLHRELVGRGPTGALRRGARAALRRLIGFLIRRADRHVALVAVGADPYWTFYFSRSAFERTFQVHHPIFSRIEYLTPPEADRAIALCTIAAPDPS